MRNPCFGRKDKKLVDFVQAHGEGHWRSLPQAAAGPVRCGESCRLRWINHLRHDDVKRGDFSEDEEDLIVKLHALLGNRWSLIAGRLPGRTDSEIKHYWNSHLRRKLASMGIDPNNHRVNQYCTMQWCSSRNNYKLKGQFKHPGNASDDDSLSDTASCVKDDQTCSRRVVPDLNLDLTISSPRDRDRVVAGEQEDMISSPTLVLFR